MKDPSPFAIDCACGSAPTPRRGRLGVFVRSMIGLFAFAAVLGFLIRLWIG